MEQATLYVIPGSHACRSAMLMLDYKGTPFEVRELPTGLHPLLVRSKGFPGHRKPIRQVDGRTHRMLALLDRGGTVPALRLGEERVQTNHNIARFLDRLQGEPPLLPVDPERRAAVEEAERWGDEVLQMAARRIVLAASAHGLDAFRDRANRGRLGPLLSANEARRTMSSRGARVTFRVSRGKEAELLATLPPMLDRIDGWIEAGVLGGEELNVADFMIVPSLALLSYRVDLRPVIAERAAGGLLERVLPEPFPDR
jgi:glutathione S-transferase